MSNDRDSAGSGPRSIAGRAAIAVFLMVGFYGLALAVVGGLLYLPYAEWRFLHRTDFRLVVFCVVGAGLILQSIVPRPDRLKAPGPGLLARRQPRLFAELGDVAHAVGQEMPAEVYLVPDVNAWVSLRGGVMGFGGHRVMGLGLPLLQSLRVSELRAVLAHELGHYHGGDTRLGPWVYKTREAIGRTLRALAWHSSVLQKPFDWYGRLFLRITLAVSRHQEYQADALAARVAGADALARGLRAVHRAALAFPSYWVGEVGPVLDAGYQPPLAHGFARFAEEPRIAEALTRAVDDELKSPRSDPYDSHPSLRDRLAALQGLPDHPAPEPDPSAVSLLEELPEVERELLAVLADAGKARGLRPLSWDEVGLRVYVPRWQAFLKSHASRLQGVTPRTLPTLDWARLGSAVAESLGDARRGDPARPVAELAIGAALGLALVRRGFTVLAPPGASIRLLRGTESLELGGLSARITERPEAWTAFCDRAEIGDLDLGRPELESSTDP